MQRFMELTMERKYQVFISSTYTDLKDERQSIINCLLMANCIPAGMEAFTATDDEQFNIIKKVIDLCDFYVLIIGNRYGTINEKTQKSYTEMEYEYALSKNIPVLAFVKEIDYDKEITSETVETRTKLKAFSKKVRKSRLCSMWSTREDLISKVALSVMKAISEGSRPGWVRNLGFDPETVTTDLNKLREKIIKLEEENEILKGVSQNEKLSLATKEDKATPDLSQYKVTLHFTEHIYLYSDNMQIKEMDVNLTLEEIFKFISVRISGAIDDARFIKELSAYKKEYDVDKQQALIVKSQLVALGMLEEVEIDSKVKLKLSSVGKRVMQELNAPRKN